MDQGTPVPHGGARGETRVIRCTNANGTGRCGLSMCLPYSSVTRWAVCIDSAVGEPFLSTSKDYPVELVRNTISWRAQQTLTRYGSRRSVRSNRVPARGLGRAGIPSSCLHEESAHLASEGRNGGSSGSSSRSFPRQPYSSPVVQSSMGLPLMLGAPYQVPSPSRPVLHDP